MALVSSPSAQAPPMAEARDNTRGHSVRIRHIPIHNEGDGGLFAPLSSLILGNVREKVSHLRDRVDEVSSACRFALCDGIKTLAREAKGLKQAGP